MHEETRNWESVLDSTAFKALMRRRRNTAAGLGVLAAVGYFSLPALIAWCPGFFTIRIAAGVNVGLLFTALQYPFGGVIAWSFLRRTAGIDIAAERLRGSIAAPAAAAAETFHEKSDHAAY